MNRMPGFANFVSVFLVVALIVNSLRELRSRQTGPRGVVRRISSVVSVLLVAGSLVTELRKPASERTWEGRVFGAIPYDFRLPLPTRAKSTFWNPSNPNILVPTFFGVGWSLNLYPIFHSVIGV